MNDVGFVENGIEELSLLVYASRGNRKELIIGLCNYTGCKEEVYNESELTKILQLTIQDISRKYHIKDLFYNYCDARTNQETTCTLYNLKYRESSTLLSLLFRIMPHIFDERDKKRIKELKAKYMIEKEDKSE